MGSHTMALSILYVESNYVNAYLAHHELEEAGYKVVYAFDAVTANRMVRVLKPPVVIVSLASQEGIAFIQSLSDNDLITVIAIVVDDEQADVAKAAGASLVLKRPIRLQQLRDSIEALMGDATKRDAI